MSEYIIRVATVCGIKADIASKLTAAFQDSGIALIWRSSPHFRPDEAVLAKVPGMQNGLLQVCVGWDDLKVRVRLFGGSVSREWEPSKSGLNVQKIVRRAQAEIRRQAASEAQREKARKQDERMKIKLDEIKQSLQWKDGETRIGKTTACVYPEKIHLGACTVCTLRIDIGSPEILCKLMQAYLDATKD